MDRINLNHLPAEILLEIGDHLSDDDRACLALCSLECLNKLGTRLFSAYKKRHTPEREAFLTRLSLSTPSLFFCYDCSCLHSWAAISAPYSLRPRGILFFNFLRKGMCNALDSSSNYVWLFQPCSYYSFKYLHLQLAMRRHHLGSAYGIDLSTLSYIEAKNSFHEIHPFFGEDIRNLTSIDALIMPDPATKEDCLYLRVQECIHARGELVYIRNLLSQSYYMVICMHVGNIPLSDFGSCQLRGTDEESRLSPDICHECAECGVNVQAYMELPGPGTVAMTITRWFNLGSGHSPKEDTWAKHGRWGFYYGFSIGSGLTRQTFEEATELPQEDLTLRNYLLLNDEAYRKLFTPRSASPFDDSLQSFWDYRGDLSLGEVQHLCPPTVMSNT